MNALRVLSSEIRQLDGLFSLTDLHKASGNARKHQPALFLRNDQTKALIEEISSTDSQIIPVKTVRGRGKAQGTYVCKELVYAYGMWISPAFHLKVIRAFDAMQSELPSHPRPLPLLLAGTPGQRFLIRLDQDGGYSAMPVPDEALVMTFQQFLKALNEPNGMPVDTGTLADFAMKTIQRLERRCAFYQEKTVQPRRGQKEPLRDQVLRLIRKGGKRGKTRRELHQGSRLFRALHPDEQNQLMDSLIGVDVVVHIIPPISGRGQPRSALVAVDHL